MSEKEAFDARQQAMRDVVGHPERPAHHEDAMRTYLAGIMYAELRARSTPPARAGEEADEPAQPVDEPAPYAQPATAPR
jgi:hypothetical protein